MLYKILHVPTETYVTFAHEVYGSFSIHTSANGKAWKTKGPCVNALKRIIKASKKNNKINSNEYVIQVFELIHTKNIYPSDL